MGVSDNRDEAATLLTPGAEPGQQRAQGETWRGRWGRGPGAGGGLTRSSPHSAPLAGSSPHPTPRLKGRRLKNVIQPEPSSRRQAPGPLGTRGQEESPCGSSLAIHTAEPARGTATGPAACPWGTLREASPPPRPGRAHTLQTHRARGWDGLLGSVGQAAGWVAAAPSSSHESREGRVVSQVAGGQC